MRQGRFCGWLNIGIVLANFPIEKGWGTVFPFEGRKMQKPGLFCHPMVAPGRKSTESISSSKKAPKTDPLVDARGGVQDSSPAWNGAVDRRP